MISLVKKDYDSTKIYRKTHKKGASQTYDTPSFCFLFSGRAVDGHQTVLSVLLFDNHLLVVDDVDAIAQVQLAH